MQQPAGRRICTRRPPVGYGFSPLLACLVFAAGRVSPRARSFREECELPACGTVDRESRKSQARFHCHSCRIRLHADHNSVIDIPRRNTASMLVDDGRRASVEAGTGSGPFARKIRVLHGGEDADTVCRAAASLFRIACMGRQMTMTLRDIVKKRCQGSKECIESAPKQLTKDRIKSKCRRTAGRPCLSVP